jgi:tetratricopeptide (TPR) repeat protein
VAAARDLRAPVRALLAQGPVLLPAAAATGVLIFLAVKDAGQETIPVTWQACNLFLLAVLALCLVAAPAAGRPPRATLLAAGLLGGYAAWSYLSIAWADQQADAWDGANRTAMYAIVFALFAFWPLGRRGATLMVGAVAAAIGLLAVIALLKADAAANPGTIFLNGRLGWPVDYPNGTVALWFIGFWPCVALASRREVHPLLRGLFLALAGVLAGTALLAQSRGWLFAVPIVTVVFVAVSPGRVRVAWSLIAVWVATLAIGRTVVDVHEAVGQGRAPNAEIDSAVTGILVAALVLGALGAGLGYLEPRAHLSAATGRRAGRVMLAAACVVLIVGFAAFVVREGSPVSWVDARWQEFKGGPQPDAGGARFTQTLGSNRYDFWRVAWHEFERRPLTGIGADNFRHEYLRARTTGEEEPYYPHSMVMRTFSQTGLVGALLLFGAIACALAAARAAIRGRPGLTAAVAAAAATSFAYFLVHGAVDWFWELPAIGGLAFAMLGVAAGLAPRRAIHPADQRAREPLARGTAPLAATAVGVGLLLAAFGPPFLAMLSTKRARDAVRDDRGRAGEALDLLDRAAGLNPASTLPRLWEAEVVIAVGHPQLAAPYYRDAIQRDPADEYSHLALAALESSAGRQPEAERLLRRAVELSPRDPLARKLLGRVRSGRRIGILDVRKDFTQRRKNREQ